MDRGEQILAAAYTVFGEKGFFTAKMDDIAQEAGVAKGTLYLYYANKEELFHAVIEKNLRDYFTEYKEILNEKKSFSDQLVSLVRHYLTFIRDRADFAKMSIQEGPLTEKLRLSLSSYVKKAGEQFVRVVQETYPGMIDEREAYLSYLSFVSMGEGMTLDMFWENRELTDEMIDERARFVAHLFVHGLGQLPQNRERKART